MIKITIEKKEEELPRLPFVTKNRYENIRLYFLNINRKISFIVLNTGSHSGQTYNSIEEVINDFESHEKIVEAELIIKG